MNKEVFLDKYISIGKIRKPHGLEGFLKILLFNEESNAILDLKYLRLKKDLKKSIDLKIESLDLNSLLVKFFGIDNRNEADKYRDYEILILHDDTKKNKDEK